MPTNNETIMNTVNEAATEVVKSAKDNTGVIFMGLGFLGGAALTIGVVKGTKVIKKKISDKKALKNAPKKRHDILVAAGKVEEPVEAE